ncbi:MAG TPA: glycosyltransferase [Longimicrobium sp.]|jgi:cellulose synthase/poly-beta-1,6-N-acetylglucosamine synthase-like glycosyltransferase|nr:glycosyltransferase [Longimicrobium sp.]
MPHDVLFWLALVTAVLSLGMLAQLLLAARQLRRLDCVPPLGDAEMPSISIVVAARNEARGIEAAMRSLLALEAPRLEVVAVDDRSEDATGAILDRFARTEPRLRVVHVAELPAGWLGKNHALWLGTGHATGELLLFTDADVVMAPDTLRRAAALLSAERLDHLTAGPHLDMPGWALQTFSVWFMVMFTLFVRPWKARDPRSGAHIGVGAFNLVRADAYRRIGTHRAIAMRPDDDMKLGKLVKKHGLRQDFVNATSHVRVEWYHSVREAMRGLRKNGFAGVDYRLSMVLLATVTQPLLFVWPFVAVWVTGGATRLLNAVVVAAALAMFAGAAREQRVRWWYGAAYPLAIVLFLAAIWNATLYALVHRGIEWRGTHYPLDELKANRV